MVTLLIIACILLLVLILLLAFRAHVLIGIIKNAYTGKVGVANKINAIGILIFFIVGLIAFYFSYQTAKPYFLPEAASVHGLATDRMFWLSMTIILIAFLVTNVLLYTFPYLYQYKEGKRAYFYPDNVKLEMMWTLLPAIVMTILVWMGLKEWNIIMDFPPEEECVVIEIMGKQFGWHVRYAGKDMKMGKYSFNSINNVNHMGIDLSDPNSMDDFCPNEIHLPKGKKILLKIRSRDVIHSVYLPHFRVKMDAVPGMATKFWFIPTKTTMEMRDQLGKPDFNYEMACTEICGKSHFAMRMVVVVDEPEEFEKWYAAQKPFVEENASSLNLPVKSKPVEQKTDTMSVAVEIKDTVNLDVLLNAKEEKSVALHINFAPNEFSLSEEAKTKVDEIYTFMIKNKDIKLEIDGHTDNTGDPKKNKELSEKRAKAIVDYLVSKGVKKNRLKAKGYGSEKPLVEGDSEQAKAMNRRVELKKIN
ncbi:MAG: OmpA family protein [Cytophagaceae bacterium]|nr:OmpA family protein [Cytophagaceae bacterium]MDW8455621.1 OmpA family protein [Cytophagaceae bacterium]